MYNFKKAITNLKIITNETVLKSDLRVKIPIIQCIENNI